MIFSLIKLVIWLCGVGVIAYFVLPYFGYEVNTHYWQERRAACEERLEACRKELIQNGLEGAKENCEVQCVDPKILIKKK